MPVSGLNGSIAHHPSETSHSVHKQHSTSSAISAGRNGIKDTQLYKRILGQSLKQVGLPLPSGEDSRHASTGSDLVPSQVANPTPYLVPPKSGGAESNAADTASLSNIQIEGLSEEQNMHLVRQVAEIAATAAAVAARDATRAPKKVLAQANTQATTLHSQRGPPSRAGTVRGDNDEIGGPDGLGHGTSGGHDAPNWSRLKSAVILLGATLLYAIIAEILVNTVDVVLESVDIDEKFLGITLFALVPNTTEFLVCSSSYVICLG